MSGAAGGPPLPDADRRWRGWRGACAWLAVLVVVLLRHQALLSADGTFVSHDWMQVHQADAEHVAQAARDGSLVPLWSPFVMGGSPFYGVATKPLSYPPFLLAAALLNSALAMNLLTLAHVLLAAAGMLVLARRLGCRPSAAAAAAILLVTATWPGSFFRSQPFWGYAMAFWPWALAAALDVLDADAPRAVLAGSLKLGALMAAQVLAGGVFQAYWLACFLAVFALPFLLRRGDPVGPGRRLAALLLAALACVLLAAVRELPALEWMHTTGRSAALPDSEILSGYDDIAAAGGGHATVAVLGQLLFRGDRLGSWSLAAGCVLGLGLARRRRVAVACAAGLLACAIIATGVLHEQLLDWLPGYDRMRLPYRFLNAAALGALVLTALGLEGLLARLPRAAAGPLLALGGLALAVDVRFVPGWRWLSTPADSMSEVQAMAAPVFDTLQDGSRRRFFNPSPRFQILWIERGLRSTAGEAGGPGSGSEAFAEWLPPNATALELEAQHRGVLDVLAVGWTASYEPLDVPWLVPVFEPRLPAQPLQDPYTRYVVLTRQQGGEPYVRPWVYRRESALAHASLVECVVLVVGAPADRAAALHAALDRRSFDARATVYVEAPDADPARLDEAAPAGLSGVLFAGADARDPAPAALRARAGGELVPQKDAGVLWQPTSPRASGLRDLDEARVESRSNGLSIDLPEQAAPLLLLSETFMLHPGWTASLDGADVPLLRADGCITALRLPPGARRVELSYRPPGFATGLAVSAASFALLGVAAFLLKRAV